MDTLARFGSVRATYFVDASTNSITGTEEILVPSRAGAIQCMPFASLFSIEEKGDELTHEENTLYAELDRTQLMLKRREVKPGNYIDYDDASRIMEIVPWSEGRQNVTLVIVKDKLRALSFASANQYERLFSFIAERIPDRQEVLLDLLLYGAEYSNLTAMKLALAEGADSNDQSNDYTALGRASRIGYIEAVKLLLDNGADMNLDLKDTPLTRASEGGHTEVAQLLIDRGADVNLKGGEALRAVVGHQNIQMAELLIKNGADVNLKYIDGRTPLYIALMMGNYCVVHLLIKHGARTDHEATPEEIERLMEDVGISAPDRDVRRGRDPTEPAQTKSKRSIPQRIAEVMTGKSNKDKKISKASVV